jgi:protein-tyrosine phosphatase
MRRLVAEADLEDSVEIDSAGTGDWHVGHAPDERATAAARARGITLEGAARQVTPADFEDYDLIVAMDRANERDLRALAPDDAARKKIVLLRSFDPGADDLDVPDPYYGGDDGFEHVLDVVDRAARGLLEQRLS